MWTKRDIRSIHSLMPNKRKWLIVLVYQGQHDIAYQVSTFLEENKLETTTSDFVRLG